MNDPQGNMSRKDVLEEQSISAAGETDPAPKTDGSACPACGMPQSEWAEGEGRGFKKDGRTYCCEGCAQGTGCKCF